MGRRIAAAVTPNEPVVCLDEKPVSLHVNVRPARPARPGHVAKRDNEYKPAAPATSSARSGRWSVGTSRVPPPIQTLSAVTDLGGVEEKDLIDRRFGNERRRISRRNREGGHRPALSCRRVARIGEQSGWLVGDEFDVEMIETARYTHTGRLEVRLLA